METKTFREKQRKYGRKRQNKEKRRRITEDNSGFIRGQKMKGGQKNPNKTKRKRILNFITELLTTNFQ